MIGRKTAAAICLTMGIQPSILPPAFAGTLTSTYTLPNINVPVGGSPVTGTIPLTPYSFGEVLLGIRITVSTDFDFDGSATTQGVPSGIYPLTQTDANYNLSPFGLPDKTLAQTVLANCPSGCSGTVGGNVSITKDASLATTSTPAYPSTAPSIAYSFKSDITATQFTVSSSSVETVSSTITVMIDQADECISITQGSVCLGVEDNPGAPDTHILANFFPKAGSLLLEAKKSGFSYFNWMQMIRVLPKNHSPSFESKSGTYEMAPPAFFDPVQGGYVYTVGCDPKGAAEDTAYPYYYSDASSLPKNDCLSLATHTISDKYLTFSDSPSDPTLSGGDSIQFTTFLVGVTVNTNGSKTFKRLYSWEWKDTYNKSSGGITITKY